MKLRIIIRSSDPDVEKEIATGQIADGITIERKNLSRGTVDVSSLVYVVRFGEVAPQVARTRAVIAKYLCDKLKNRKDVNLSINYKPVEINTYSIEQLIINIEKEKKERVRPRLNKQLVDAAIYLKPDMLVDAIERGADLNAQGARDGKTALMEAVTEDTKSAWKIVRLLVEKGAHLEAKNKKGKTALKLAYAKGEEYIVGILISAGAEDTLRTARALDNVFEIGVWTAVILLLAFGIYPILVIFHLVPPYSFGEFLSMPFHGWWNPTSLTWLSFGGWLVRIFIMLILPFACWIVVFIRFLGDSDYHDYVDSLKRFFTFSPIIEVCLYPVLIWFKLVPPYDFRSYIENMPGFWSVVVVLFTLLEVFSILPLSFLASLGLLGEAPERRERPLGEQIALEKAQERRRDEERRRREKY